MISSSKAVVIAQLVILARKNPGTSPLHILFSHNKDPFDGINKWDVQDTTLESFYFYRIDDSKRHCQSYQHRNRLKFPRVN